MVDITGSEVWGIESDEQASYRRTLSYHKPISNMLISPNSIDTNEKVENYIESGLFYGGFPGISQIGNNTTNFWGSNIHEDYREMYKKYILITKMMSSAGWEPIPYAICNYPDIMFERYGWIEDGLYYTVANNGSDAENGVLTVNLLKFGFNGTIVEVKELVTNTTYMQDVQNSKLYIRILELHTHNTLVYKINPC